MLQIVVRNWPAPGASRGRDLVAHDRAGRQGVGILGDRPSWRMGNVHGHDEQQGDHAHPLPLGDGLGDAAGRGRAGRERGGERTVTGDWTPLFTNRSGPGSGDDAFCRSRSSQTAASGPDSAQGVLIGDTNPQLLSGWRAQKPSVRLVSPCMWGSVCHCGSPSSARSLNSASSISSATGATIRARGAPMQ
jgi:hypothetical protein